MPLTVPPLLILSKAPIAGYAKTRLSRVLGDDCAARISATLTHYTVSALASWPGGVELWCAPDASHEFFHFLASNFDVSLRTQQGSDLGERIFYALAQHERAILVGCDSPTISNEILAEASERLSLGDQLVTIPTEDGGFSLVAASLPKKQIFLDIDWGSDRVMDVIRKNIKREGIIASEMTPAWDIDEPTDLPRLVAVNEFAKFVESQENVGVEKTCETSRMLKFSCFNDDLSQILRDVESFLCGTDLCHKPLTELSPDFAPISRCLALGVTGSLSYGGFIHGKSDIDVIAVASEIRYFDTDKFPNQHADDLTRDFISGAIDIMSIKLCHNGINVSIKYYSPDGIQKLSARSGSTVEYRTSNTSLICPTHGFRAESSVQSLAWSEKGGMLLSSHNDLEQPFSINVYQHMLATSSPVMDPFGCIQGARAAILQSICYAANAEGISSDRIIEIFGRHALRWSAPFRERMERDLLQCSRR